MFSERHGIPSDVNYFVFMEQLLGTEVTPNRILLEWVAKGEPSNFPTLASHMQRFSTFTPWQLHSVTRKVFAGRVPGVQAGAMAYDAVGRPPFAIAISDGMYAIADQCIYLWEVSTRILQNALYDTNRGLSKEDVESRITQALNARGIRERLDGVIKYLLGPLRSGRFTSSQIVEPADLVLPVTGVAAIDLDHRYRLFHAWEQFVLAHELGHIILGHLGPANAKTASSYAHNAVLHYRELPTWTFLDNVSQQQEADADLFGLFEFSYATSWEIRRRESIRPGWRDRSQLALMIQHLEGAAVASLAFYFLSELGVPTRHSSSHPHPDRRIKLVTEEVLRRMERIIEMTGEPNEGPAGPGVFERNIVFARMIPHIYRRLTEMLEVTIDRQGN